MSDKASEIASEIADAILELNKKQPAAVVMVGGGSSLAILREKVADKLGLPRNRVGSRMPENVMPIDGLPPELKGAEGITPVGILETALSGRGLGFVDVYLNGEKEYIVNLEQEIKVMDVLMSAGLDMKALYGRPGSSITYTLNGKLGIIRGQKAEHAKIFINGVECDIYRRVSRGDKIFITAAKDGRDASAKIGDALPPDSFMTVEINGRPFRVEPVIYLNNRQVAADEPLPDRAEIKTEYPVTAEEILAKAGYGISKGGERDIIITLNSEPVVLKQRNYRLKANGSDISPDYRVKSMDKLEYSDTPSFFRIKDLTGNMPPKKMRIKINGREFEIETVRQEITMNGRKASPDEFIINGANIEVRMSEERPLLSSIFRVFPIDSQKMRGKLLELKVNGEKAGYTTQLSEGAEIEVNFI
ncbi:MAG TPA: hypothetical protein P5511_01585 [Candidatus Goldiibacteriota bacterium]|nr:hypothetical protein [Candidatus Goldiibacteriota bacterium]